MTFLGLPEQIRGEYTFQISFLLLKVTSACNCENTVLENSDKENIWVSTKQHDKQFCQVYET